MMKLEQLARGPDDRTERSTSTTHVQCEWHVLTAVLGEKNPVEVPSANHLLNFGAHRLLRCSSQAGGLGVRK